MDYWKDIDSKLASLLQKGYVKLPSLEIFDLHAVAESINSEMNGATFTELCASHKLFLDDSRKVIDVKY